MELSLWCRDSQTIRGEGPTREPEHRDVYRSVVAGVGGGVYDISFSECGCGCGFGCVLHFIG